MDVPTLEDRGWLLDELARLIADGGAAPFLDAPIIEPNDRYFPDPWEPTPVGIERLAVRLLGYAGLGHLRVRAATWVGAEASHTAAVFTGIERDVCHFGVDAQLFEGPERTVAALCHEVAHAYRRYHRFEQPDERAEELLTDLTCVFLGFGVLSTNAALLYRTSGENYGYLATFRSTTETLGYLPYQAMSFLLAAQARARNLSFFQRRHLASLLEPSQAASFTSACRLLRDRRALRAALRLEMPVSPTRPQESPEQRAVAPSPSSAPPAEAEIPPDVGLTLVAGALTRSSEEGPNAGRPVFRLERNRRWLELIWFASLGFVAACLLVWTLPTSTLYPFYWAPVCGAIFGYLRGRKLWFYECASCETSILPTDTTCSGCGGTISGKVERREDRLEAEDALLDARRMERRLSASRAADRT